MTQVFISYSRKDIDFVRRLHEALEARQHDTWVDWEGIPPVDKWMDRIHAAIDATEAFCFVISPDSITSDVCSQELAYAVEHNKRLIPILHREPDAPVPQDLAKINYVFAREDDPFEPVVDTLIEAIETDLDWVRAHTRLLVRAVEWDTGGREPSFTLRGRDLTDFEDWAAQAPDKEPKPTVLQSEYLLASRRAVTKRQRITWGSVAAGLVIAATLGTVAWFQNQERDRQAEIASARQLLSRAEALRDVPESDPDANRSRAQSLHAAARALQSLERLAEPTFDADRATRKSFQGLAKWTGIEYGIGRVDYSAFDPTGRYLALNHGMALTAVWDIVTGRKHAECKTDLDLHVRGRALSLASDGSALALYVDDTVSGPDTSPVFVWSLPGCRPLFDREFDRSGDDSFRGLALTADGQTLVIQLKSGLEIHDLKAGTSRTLTTEHHPRYFALSPDGSQIATLEIAKIDGQRHRWIRVRALDSLEIVHEIEIERGHNLTWTPGGMLATRTRVTFADGAPRLATPLSISSAVLSPDGSQAAKIVNEYSVEVVDTETGTLIARGVRRASFDDLAFTPDGTAIAIVDKLKKEIAIWHHGANAAFATLTADAPATAIGFSPAGDRLWAETSGTRTLWSLPAPSDPAAPTPAGTEAAPPAADPETRTTAPDKAEENVLAEATNRAGITARIVDTGSSRGGLYRQLEIQGTAAPVEPRPLDPVLDRNLEIFLQFAGNGRFLVVASRIGFDVLEAETGKLVTTLYHTGAIVVGMRPDGQQAVTVGRDRSARIWQLGTGQELVRLDLPSAPSRLALSPDGRWLATQHGDRRIALWALSPPDLIAQSCRWLDAEDGCP